MAPKTYWWISAWFLLTAPVVAWDVGYCLMRPRSMRGGDLHWIWKPYSLYQDVDYIYGLPALEANNGFTSAQALLNIFETLLNLVYLYLAHIKEWPPATLIGFTSAACTLAKTILYGAQDYYCGWCSIGHNKLYDLAVLWILPNGFWIVVPTFIVWTLGKDLVRTINVAAKVTEGKKAQ